MGIVDFSLKRPVTVVMLMAALVLFGWISFNRLPINLLPDISYPAITVRTAYPGSAPSEVENHVTIPIEEAISVIPNVTQVSSVSSAGRSDVVVEFGWKTDMDYASFDIREKLNAVDLPEDAVRPILLRFNPAFDPIIRISLYGDESLVKLRLIAEEDIKPALEALSPESRANRGGREGGIAAVKVSGGLEEEIHVGILPERLTALGIQISDISRRLAEENINLTGGTVYDGEVEYLVRTLTEFRQIGEISEIVILSDGVRIVTLGDIATVTKGHKDRDVITRTNGKESIEIAIFKEADANTTNVAGLVRERLEELQSRFDNTSGNIRLRVMHDQSSFISQSVNDVMYAAIFGGLLAICTLYLFLRNIRSTVIIGLAIPLSVMACFFFMYISNVTINIMSLGGLAIGIGLLVDNSIVVLESIDRYRQKGYGQREAARRGATDVSKAVIASTLTTVCVFAPMVFVKGIVGQLFIDQALTVIYSLLTSLLVAVTLIPMLSAFDITIKLSNAAGRGRQSAGRKGCALPFISAQYVRVLAFVLQRRLIVIVITLICGVGAWQLLKNTGREFIPELDHGEFFVHIMTPDGTPIESTLERVKTIEDIIKGMPEVVNIYAIAGMSGQAGISPMEESANCAEIAVMLGEDSSGKTRDDIVRSIREELSGMPEMEYKFSYPALFSFITPIEVAITGYNIERLRVVSDRIAERMADMHNLADVRTTMDDGNPEIQISFNRQKLAKMGMDINSIATAIRSYVSGSVKTDFRHEDRKINIRVVADRKDLKGIAGLKNLTIRPGGVPVRLDAVAEIRREIGAASIHRRHHERVAVVSANLASGDLHSAIRKIEDVIGATELPAGVEVNVSGQSREMFTAFSSMKFAIVLAIFLVYLVMASQFESLLNPLVIMITIPFAVVGSAVSLYATNSVISVAVLIGVVMLAGIVVNNAIVLVDCVNQHRRKGMEMRRAVTESATLRLRPILMTTTTTILALAPMSIGFGAGSELRAAMGITVIGGLFTSTVLTLIIIPLVYDLVEDWRLKINYSGSQAKVVTNIVD